ncbi:pyridoxamine 5'-phosphate oxidase family protein [Streptomyces sp. NE06-03E]|uniref:pyridoxamine 5'-phosphate oxidase family protein n=1 Tax=unclassified Streptomyces TaxID=2593676 RepID=UPI0029A07677|nr:MULTISPECIES: pyridoxamine 5'-phosphate oxidase family protein [unclassified Streptomyces]MDX3054283.1 pyridoxamine 5'-phosphate oxidase family protein [Streptomyces sp. NE06-03E]
MSTITQDMINIVESAKLMFVATVRPDGTPNLSPKGSVRVLDSEHLIFADIASPQTVANVRANPAVEVNVVDFLLRRGYRFRGTAEVLEPDGTEYAWIADWLRETHGERTPCHHAIKITVSESAEVLSPGYTVEHVPEPELRAAWVAKYGLREASTPAAC